MIYASMRRRLGAFIIDALLLSTISLPLWIWFLLSVRVTPAVSMEVYLLGLFSIWYFFSLFYFIGYWIWRGQTPGQMLTRVKIVRKDDQKIKLINVILRYLIGYSIVYIALSLLIVPAIVLFIAAALNNKKRGLHDLIAGTCVVKIK
jgi:uncharacterized RDD family membrane protein YckC